MESSPVRPIRRKISKGLRAEIFATHPSRCAECGWKPGDPTRRPRSRPARKGAPYWFLEIDHIIPVVAGGTNDPANLRLLCSGCNASKGARDRANLNRDW